MGKQVLPDLQVNLLNELQAFVREHGNGTVINLAQPLLRSDLDRIDVPPIDHQAVHHISEVSDCVYPAAQPLYEAMIAALPTLAWQVSYTNADGFSDEYIRRYAWCDVIGPNGIYLSDNHRIGFGFWRKGLFYPPHEHGPEEIYWVIGGAGKFTSGNAEPVVKGPGSIIHHEPWVRHSIDMSDSSMLVLFLWRGENLHERSNF